DALGDDGGKEAVQGLLGAAIGIIDQVGKGIDHGAGQGGRIANFQARLVDAPLGRHSEVDVGLILVGPDYAGERFHPVHAVDIGGEAHLHGIRLVVGESLDADDRLALGGDLDTPIDALVGAGLDADLLHQVAGRGQDATVQFQRNFHILIGLQVVVDVGGQDDFVFLGEESRRLQADDEVLLGDDLGRAFADLGAVAHAPDLHLPASEIFRHVK